MAYNSFRKPSLGGMAELPYFGREVESARNSIDREDRLLSLDDDDLMGESLGQFSGEFPDECQFQDGKGVPLAHSTGSLMAIMDEHLLTSLKTKKGIVRSETEAFEAYGPRTYPSDRRKEFRAYLGHTKFITGITNLIVKLYKLEAWPEPEEAVNFIAMTLGYTLAPSDAAHQKQKKIVHEDDERTLEIKAQIDQIQKDLDGLRRRLDDYEDTETPVELVDPEKLPPFKVQKAYAHDLEVASKSKKRSS